MKEGYYRLIKITRQEMEYLVHKGIKFGEGGIVHSTARHRRNYWCTESKQCLSLLDEYHTKLFTR